MTWGDSYWLNETDFQIILVVEGRPAVLKNSKQIVTRGKGKQRPILIPSKRAAAWLKEARKQFAEQSILSEPIKDHVQLHVQVMTYAHDRRRRDLDNAFGGPLDALMPDEPKWCGIITDDSQVKSLDGSRLLYDKEYPRVEITIRPYKGEVRSGGPPLIALSELAPMCPGERLEAIDTLTRNHETVIRELDKLRNQTLVEQAVGRIEVTP